MVFELNTYQDDFRPVFIAGNFNNWNENDERFQMNRIAEGHYHFHFPEDVDISFPVEYKYTRGAWSDVELDNYGNFVRNHRLDSPAEVIVDTVPRWQDGSLHYKKEFLPDIRVSKADLDFPAIIKTRRIAALLPHNYEQTNKRYPVLYLQDGQNLFDDYAPYGSWGVDKKMAYLAERGLGDIIIVAIDHAQEKRISEYTPMDNPRTGKGLGKAYARFLATTLKPHIDTHFRTIPDREHTGIGGSSMGGLISIYAGLMYPDIFSKLMIFSPSLWVAPNLHFHAINFTADLDTRIYVYAGGNESKTMVPNVERFITAIMAKGHQTELDFELSIDPDGIHNEAQWGMEFPRALEWLFFRED